MKKIFLTLSLLTMSVMLYAASPIFVDFDSSSLPEGWTSTGVTFKKDNGSTRAAMSTKATITTAPINNPTQIAYKHRGSGSNKTLTVEKSIDNGQTWTEIGSVKVSSSSTYGSGTHAINESTTSGVLIRITCSSATIFVDDIEIAYVNLAQEPTKQASLSTSDIKGNTLTLNVEKGNGEGRLVAYQKGDECSFVPEDGVAYVGNFPKTLEDGTVLVASDNAATLSVSGLLPGETYSFVAYEYNGVNDNRNYLTTSPATLKATTLTVPSITPEVNTIAFKNVKTGESKVLTLNITAKFLTPATGKLSLTSSSSTFNLSNDGTTYAQNIEVPYTDATLTTTVHVKFTPTDLCDYSAIVNISGGNAQSTVTLTGKGAETSVTEYYLAPDGNDAGDGSFTQPWMNLQHAVNQAKPGDVIICRGGRYKFTTRDSSGKLTVRIKTSGTADAPITIRNYEGETPIFDFEQQLLDCNRSTANVGDRGILLTGNYWHLYGLHIMHAADNAIKLEGSHNRIERCEFSYNLDTGIQLGFGHNFADSGLGSKNDGSFCAYNDIIDCDSHHNCDYDSNYGSDADGFACKMHNGKGNRFIRCRAWRNSDDAWDLYETDFDVTLIECWAWESGNAEDHLWVKEYFDSGHGFSGNGNGIKLGGNGTGGSSEGVHYAYNCIAFGCDKSGSTKGFDCNSHKGGHVIIGGLAFDNGYDFMFESGGGSNSEFYNNVCFGRQEILVGSESNNAYLGNAEQGKTFYKNLVSNFSRSDYESLSETDALAPRGTDGSMPPKFGRLKSGSKLVDAGLNKPVPYTDEFPFLYQPIYGAARDLGPYELVEGGVSTDIQTIMNHEATTSLEVIQGQYSGEAILKMSSAIAATVRVSVCDLNGKIIMMAYSGTIEQGADYYLPINTTSLPQGVYVVMMSNGQERIARKMVVNL